MYCEVLASAVRRIRENNSRSRKSKTNIDDWWLINDRSEGRKGKRSKQTVLCTNKCLSLRLQIRVVALSRIEGKGKLAIRVVKKCLQYHIVSIQLSAQINRKIWIFFLKDARLNFLQHGSEVGCVSSIRMIRESKIWTIEHAEIFQSTLFLLRK
jgi:hypothetical protein